MSGVRQGQLNAAIPAVLTEELVEILVKTPALRVERIISRGHVSPPEHWYDQTEAELVVLVSGRARLEIEHEGELELAPGSWVELPAHVRHRVSWTAPEEDTVWLAVFYPAQP